MLENCLRYICSINKNKNKYLYQLLNIRKLNGLNIYFFFII